MYFKMYLKHVYLLCLFLFKSLQNELDSPEKSILSETETERTTPDTRVNKSIHVSSQNKSVSLKKKSTSHKKESKPINLNISKTTSKSISVEWSPQKNDISKYILKYECEWKFCSQKWKNEKSVSDTKYTIKNLKPLTKCSIQLEHRNEILDLKNATTKNLIPYVDEKELPIIIYKLQNKYKNKFNNCSDFNGPLKYNITFKCISEQCRNDGKTESYHMDIYKKTLTLNTSISSLFPFSNYSLTIYAYRENIPGKERSFLITTPPGIPKSVREITINCRNETALWINWKPPYPPTGVISTYKITIKNEDEHKTNNFDSKDTNKVIGPLKNNTSYKLKITAKNENVSDYGKPSESLSLLKFEISEFEKLIFENFEILPGNIVRLTWSHPVLKDFIIRINRETTKLISNSCQKTYKHELKLNDKDNNYTITIYPKGLLAPNKINIKIATKFANFSTYPFVTFCLESKCELLVPEPIEAIRSRSNVNIFVENRQNKTENWSIPNLNFSNNYFRLEIGDKPGHAVSLEDEKYSLSLKLNSTIVYSQSNFEEDVDIAKISSLALLGVTCVVTVVFLGYLCYAYKFAVYPFELRKKNQQINESSIMPKEFSEHYRQHNIKKIRPKCDLPSESSELKPLVFDSTSSKNSVCVEIDNFETYLMTSMGNNPQDNELTEQFRKIPNVVKPRTVGLLKRNIHKNRYKKLTAFDETRVKLKNNSEYSYINANYVNGYKSPRAFIATQAPMDSTVGDFWWMIWQENVGNIIMLCELVLNGIEKCVQYWPDVNKDVKYGRILIRNVSEKIYSDFIHRKLIIFCDEEERCVEQFQYTTWPDHNVPLYPQNFTQFIKILLAMPQQNSPIVVHCNAGCGRTGTLILCDIVLRMAAKERKLDFVKNLTEMRAQRDLLVSNVDQYIFAHFIVLECLFGVDFSIPINDSFQDEIHKVLRKTTIKPMMDQLEKVMMQFKKRQMSQMLSLTDEDKIKNRFSKILPVNSRLYLPVTWKHPSSYINAVVVDCYRCPKKFIVTQQPLPETLDDFWRMIKYYKINTIVSLNEIEENDEECPKFWLLDNKSTSLKILEETETRICSFTKLNIIETQDESTEKTINILKMKNWKRQVPNPPSPKDLIMIWKEMFSNSWKGDSQIVITCFDGVTASGLFVALAFLLEKINYEQICDVFSAIRAVRQSREEFVQEWGQMEFLYKAAQVYVEEFDNYHNFQD